MKQSLVEINDVKSENINLKKQLKDQEIESVNAMKAIEKQIEFETNTAIEAIQKQLEVESKNNEEQNTVNGQKRFTDLEKEYKKKLSDMKEKKDRILEDLVKLQAENDVAKEKADSMEKNLKIKRNLKIFNTMVKQQEKTMTKDECMKSVSYEGDFDSVNQLERLNSLKQSGSSRSCPQTQPTGKPMLKCDKCDFLTQNSEYFKSHMKGHDDEKISHNVINLKRPCHYVGTSKGCFKGDKCNFDHSEASLAKPVVKIPKLCRDEGACAWKPWCKYIHPEDGVVLLVRNVARDSARQGFGTLDYSHQPPGWTRLFPPSRPTPPAAPAQDNQIPQSELERRSSVIEQFIKLIVPNLMCMTEFPNLLRK